MWVSLLFSAVLSVSKLSLYDGLVLVIGDQYITLSDLLKREGLYMKMYESSINAKNRAEFIKAIRKNVISDEIFARMVLELGKEMKIKVSDKEAEGYMSKSMKESEFKDVFLVQKKVERIISYMRVTDPKFKDVIQAPVSQEEVSNYYTAHRKDFLVEGASVCVIAVVDLKGGGLKDDIARDEFLNRAKKILERAKTPKLAQSIFKLFNKKYKGKYRFALSDFSKSVDMLSAFDLIKEFPQEIVAMVLSPMFDENRVYRFPPSKIPSLGNAIYEVMFKIFRRGKVQANLDDKLKKQIIEKIREQRLQNWVKSVAFKRGIGVKVVDGAFWKSKYFDVDKAVLEFMGGSK